MRCRICREPAGWWRRTCRECGALWAVWQQLRPAGMGEILDVFVQSGVSRQKIEKFLAGEPRKGEGAIRDQIAADMSNQLLAALGQRPVQNPASVRRLRERGAWRGYDRRPE